MQSEVIALLFPEATATPEGKTPLVTALMRDAQGFIELRSLCPDATLLRAARVTGRMKSGKPIVDPHTREVIGYELEPLPLPAH